MPVRHLRRIALAFRRDGLHALFVDCAAGRRGQHHPEAQLRQQRHPEREVLIHVQHAGNAQFAARGLFGGQRLIVEHALELVRHHVRAFFARCGLAQPLFAAVACDVPPSAGEEADRQHTMVRAALTARRPRLPLQAQNVLNRQGRGGGIAAPHRTRPSCRKYPGRRPPRPQAARTRAAPPCCGTCRPARRYAAPVPSDQRV